MNIVLRSSKGAASLLVDEIHDVVVLSESDRASVPDNMPVDPVLVQDRSTSVVNGMPRAVAEAGLAAAILPLDEIVPEVRRRI